MPIVKRVDVKMPTLAREVVPFAPLGGDVVVRGIGLGYRISVQNAIKRFGVGAIVPVLLSLSVVGDDDEPLGSQEDWEALGVQHKEAVLELFKRAYALSGLDGEAAQKNS